MYKAGDKFEVVSGGEAHNVFAGRIVKFESDIGGYGGNFSTFEGIRFPATYDPQKLALSTVVRPLRSEAEKRGAKFGVTGVVKGSSTTKGACGKKISFVSDSITSNIRGEALWTVCYEDGETDYYHPSHIRLDHEPEYKEIPFSEATREQRMDVCNLMYRGSPVVQISHFPGSGYAFTCKGSFDIRTDANNLKIRIPT